MNYASKGLKMVLWGEGLEIIGLIIVSMIKTIFEGKGVSNDSANVAIAISAIGVTLVSCLIIFFGLVKAGKEERSFCTAWGLLFGYFIGQVVVNVVWMNNPNLSHVKDFIPSLIDFIVTIFIFKGMLNLLEKRNNSRVYDKTKSSFVIYIVATVIGLVLILINDIFGFTLKETSQTGTIVFLILSVIYLVFVVVAYIKYLVSLGRVSAAVEE